MKRLVGCLAALFVVSATAWSANFYTEDFNDPGLDGKGNVDGVIDMSGVTNFTIDTSDGIFAAGDYFAVANSRFENRDTDGTCIWESVVIDISGAGSVNISVDAIEEGDHENLAPNDFFDLMYSVDGGAYSIVTNWNDLGDGEHTLVGDKPDDGDWVAATVTVSSISGTSLQIRVRMRNNAGSELIYLDNVVVSDGAAPSNEPPVLDPIGAQNVAVGQTLNFGVTASDPVDGDVIGLWAENLPAGASFPPVTNTAAVSNSFDWVGAGPVGTYTTTFYAVDQDGTNLEVVVITVDPKTPPVLNPIGAQSIWVGGILTFQVTAEDTADGDSIGLWAENLPAGASFGPVTNIAGVTNTFDWISAAPVGVYTTTFFAVDVDGTNSEDVVITVDPKTAPVLAAIGNQVVTEGDPLVLDISATPTEGDAVTLSVSNNPAGSGYYPTNEFGTFEFTNATPVGVYTLTFWAVDVDGSDSEEITITVNAAPLPNTNLIWINEFHYDNIGTDSNEGFEVAGVAGTVLDGYLVYRVEGGTGLLEPTPNVLSGTIPDEGCGYGALWFDFAVAPENGPDGILLADPNTGLVHFISYEAGFLGAEDPINGVNSEDVGVVEDNASTLYTESIQLVGTGTSVVNFVWANPTNRSPGLLNDLQVIEGCSLTNQPPVLNNIGPKNETVGNPLSFVVTAQDEVDGDDVGLWAINLPAGATFDPVTNAVGVTNTFNWASVGPAGVYTATFVAADADGQDTEDVIFTIDPAPVVVTSVVWINEFHYDNAGTDSNEAFEIAGQAGTDLTNYFLAVYDGDSGSSGQVIYIENLVGVIPDEGCGYGALWFTVPVNTFQNGSDGMALADPNSNMVYFISYEGEIRAIDGPAAGADSELLPVQESSSAWDNSIQLQGTGTGYGDFTWVNGTRSVGLLNTNQTIAACGGPVDTDGDGCSDDSETNILGTNPADPSDCPVVTAKANVMQGSADIIFHSISGMPVTVQATTNLVVTDWFTVNVVTGSEPTTSYTDSHDVSSTTRTYRVVYPSDL